MTTLSTASTYITKINSAYPIAGQDNNNSQGFRDNFKNIKLSLDYVDQDVYNIKLNSVVLTNPVNDFNDNVIQQAVLQDCSVAVYDDTDNIQTGDVVIDYKNGSFQKFKIGSGTHTFTVSNWPGQGKSGSVVVVITPSSSANTYVNFNAINVYNLSMGSLPVKITSNSPTVFQLWSDGNDDNLYVRQVTSDLTFTKPAVLVSYTSSTLASITGTVAGSLVFLTSGYNKPAYYNGTNWYVVTGTIVTL